MALRVNAMRIVIDTLGEMPKEETAGYLPAGVKKHLQAKASTDRQRACRRLRAAVANAVIVGLISVEFGRWIIEDIDAREAHK
jgi:hypothetical protein